jgi:hypothetical protein
MESEMFAPTRSAVAGHARTIFTVAEAALSSAIVFASGLAFGAAIGFF